MFEQIAILLKNNLHLGSEVIEKINLFFPGSKIKIIAFNNLKKEDLLEIDLVITIGGDGTFVKAAHLIEDSLIFGINSNPETSEGALTSIRIEEIDKLQKLLQNNFNIIERQRAEIKLNNKILPEKAINEVYIGAASQFHTSRYKINYKDKIEEQRSSGVLVSTGSGSKAWFLSAGGKPFHYSEKKLSFIIREPYFGERIFIPSILNGEILVDEKLSIESTRDSGSIVAINDSIYDFNTGDQVEIKLSDKPLKVVVV